MNIDVKRDPALAWLTEQAILAALTSKQLIVSGGLGIDEEQVVSLPSDNAQLEQALIESVTQRRTPIYNWRGLDLLHTRSHFMRVKDNGYAQTDLLAALDAAQRSGILSQEALDFVTLRDITTAALETAIPSANGDPFEYDVEHVNLMYAFRNQVVAEAASHRYQVATGYYVLERPELPIIDSELVYETLRLAITPKGILGAFVQGDEYAPFWWTPEGTNTVQVWVFPRVAFAVDLILACVWRDACIVREAWRTERRGVKGAMPRSRIKHTSSVMLLPRVIYKSRWGTSDADRESATDIARRAHTVRGFYRRMPDGWQAHEAVNRAAEWTYPPPPDGYTFVAPHQRGIGEVKSPVRRVVCRGLQVAALSFGK